MILPTKSLYETHENQNGFSRKSKTILVSFVTRIKNSFVPLSSISIQLNMANVYEERLGTDRMLPLIFRMALPAIAAQEEIQPGRAENKSPVSGGLERKFAQIKRKM